MQNKSICIDVISFLCTISCVNLFILTTLNRWILQNKCFTKYMIEIIKTIDNYFWVSILWAFSALCWYIHSSLAFTTSCNKLHFAGFSDIKHHLHFTEPNGGLVYSHNIFILLIHLCQSYFSIIYNIKWMENVRHFLKRSVYLNVTLAWKVQNE